MPQKFFFFFCLLFATLQGENIQKYFKKIEGSLSGHQMKNVDCIYMINLDQRPEKFERSAKLLAPYGIVPYRFSAVNGWELPLSTINAVGIRLDKPLKNDKYWGTCYLPEDTGQPHHELVQRTDRTYFCHCMSRGAVAIVLSHLSILQDAYNRGFETIWVMEDDIDVIQDPRKISKLISRLDDVVGEKNWDVLFTDQDTKNSRNEYVKCSGYAWRPNFEPEDPKAGKKRKNVDVFRQVGARFGAYSMIVRRSGMRKILNFIKDHQIFLPYDMDFAFPHKIHLYTVQDDVVSTLIHAPSDNGGPNYAKKDPS